jgi:hypothetical protein
LQRLHATALTGRKPNFRPAGRQPSTLLSVFPILPDGRIIEFTRSHYRGDSYDFVAELTIVPEEIMSHGARSRRGTEAVARFLQRNAKALAEIAPISNARRASHHHIGARKFRLCCGLSNIW